MNRRTINKSQSIINLSLSMLLLFFISTGCGIVKNPLRDYSEKPFNSQEWLKGDSIERGRMIKDIFIQRVPNGKSKEKVLELFGEPDKKSSAEGREVWLYRVDLGHNQSLPYFPISFDSKRGTFVGSVKGGTMSMLVEE